MNNDKHLEFIQYVITRMNQNSFQTKNWMITIVAALLALYAGSTNVKFIFVAIASTIIFWLLDSYYLQQERKFIGVYNDVAGLTPEAKRENIRPFEMPIQKYNSGKYSYINVLFSVTELGLYFPVCLCLVIAGYLLMGKR